MIRELDINGVRWVDGVDLDKKEIQKVLEDYEFHELDIEASVEEHQRARIDKYTNYLFVVLHFPKYNPRTRVYQLNEFNVFLGKKFILTFRDYTGTHVDRIFERYQEIAEDQDNDAKINAGFVLYEIIQSMLEKMFKVVTNIKADIRDIEAQVFDNIDSSLVKDIMVKKRNIKFLKNMFKPQMTVLHNLEEAINQFYKGTMELYFEDLEDKLGYIIDDINVVDENIESIEDAFKGIIEIKTGRVIQLLTIFSACIMPMTLVTSFYGMNVSLPYQQHAYIVYGIIVGSFFLVLAIYILLKMKGKI